MIKKFFAIIVLISLSSCALTHEKVSTWSDDKIESMLHGLYHDDQQLLAEANRRELFTSDELFNGIKLQRAFIGMSEKALFVSWGKPNRTNTRMTTRGLSKQHVYGGNRYVYTENGKVTSISY